MRSLLRGVLPTTVALLLAVPAATAGAKVVLGPALDASSLTNQMCTSSVNECTYLVHSLPPGQTVTAPTDGVITGWRIQSNVAQVKLRVLRPAGAAFTGVGTSAEVTTSGDTSTPTFPTRLKVKAGDYIGVDNGSQALMFNQSPPAGASTLGWDPALADNSTLAPDMNNPPLELMVQADLEPDADGDGYGDETQDQCPNDATAHTAPCPAPPATTTTTTTTPPPPPGTTTGTTTATTTTQTTTGANHPPASAPSLKVSAKASSVKRGKKLTVKVSVANAGTLTRGTLVVTLTLAHAKTLSASVPFSAKGVTAVLKVPRTAKKGRYTLGVRLAAGGFTSLSHATAKAKVHVG